MGKATELSPLFCPPCIHAVMKLSKDGDGFFGTTVFCYDFPKAISADHVKCLGQINISRLVVSVLFRGTFLAAVLQQAPCLARNWKQGDSAVIIACLEVPFSVCKYGWWRRPWNCSFIHISRIMGKSLPVSVDPPSLYIFAGIELDPSALPLESWRIAIWTYCRVGVTSSDSLTGTCSSRSMALLIEDGLFSTPIEMLSPPLQGLVFSNMSLVPSALRSGDEPVLVKP